MSSTQNVFAHTKPEIRDTIYEMLSLVHTLCQKNDINYWICAGTLLGAVRHQDLIPWDDDADVKVDARQRRALLAALKTLDPTLWSFHRMYFGYKLCPAGAPRSVAIEGCKYRYPALDIFLMQANTKTGQYEYFTEEAALEFSKEFHLLSEVFPLRLYTFGALQVFGPREPRPYLDRAYGTNWNEVAWKNYNHEHEIGFERVTIPLSKAMNNDEVP